MIKKLFVLAVIFSISQADLAQCQITTALPRLEYSFKSGENLVYKVTYNSTKKSDKKDFIKNGKKKGKSVYYLIQRINEVDENKNIFIRAGGLIERKGTEGYSKFLVKDFKIDKYGNIPGLFRYEWFYVNMPRFKDEVKNEWSANIILNLGSGKAEEPVAMLNAKYIISGKTNIDGRDLLIIESEVTGAGNISKPKEVEAIQIKEKGKIYFDYKEGKVYKMEIEHFYKVIANIGEKQILDLEEISNITYELSSEPIQESLIEYALK
jgi:hypothetical protein